MVQGKANDGAAGAPPQAADIKSELKSDAKSIGAAAQERLTDKAGEGKDQATQLAKSTSQALNKAIAALRDDQSTPSWLTSAFEKSAKGLEEFAARIEGKDVQAIVRDIGGYARSNPVAFLAISAAAGFAGARVLRAGGDYREHSQDGAQRQGALTNDRPAGSTGPGGSHDRSSFAWADDKAASSSSLEGVGQ